MKFPTTLLFLAATSRRFTAVLAAKRPCSQEWMCGNGITLGPVNDTDSCLKACLACEGVNFQCPVFSSSAAEDGNGTTATAYYCQCHEHSHATTCGGTSPHRELCTDPDYQAGLEDDQAASGAFPMKDMASLSCAVMFILTVMQ